ncbi:hypothetical protein Tco_0818331, partial [Tanacetum coccineum]
GRYTYLFEHLKAQFLSRKSFDTLADLLQEVMVKSLPIMVDTHIKEQVKKQVPEQVRDQVPVYVAEGLILERQNTKEEMERMIAKAILQERGNMQAEISSQIQNAIDNHIPSQLQQQDIAIWLALQMKFENLQTSEYEAYVSGESSSGQVNEEERDDDEIPTKQVSQDIMEEVSLTIDEAKLKKMADEILRQRCTSGDEHQYHIDQIKNFLKSSIVWESRKKEVQGLRRLYCHFTSFLQLSLMMMISKNELPDGKQKEPKKPKEVIYSNSKIIQVIKRYWELGHEHKFITDLVARRGNECIVSITEPDYKNLNKNDIEDMYLLIMNGKVPDYAETGLLWSLSVFIISSVIWERVHDFQLGIESYQHKVNLTAPTISFP